MLGGLWAASHDVQYEKTKGEEGSLYLEKGYQVPDIPKCRYLGNCIENAQSKIVMINYSFQNCDLCFICSKGFVPKIFRIYAFRRPVWT